LKINPSPEELASLFSKTSRVVVLTGAGVSAESGVATFRDKTTGLWSKFNPQQLANFTSFLHDPKLVWDWYDFRKQAIHSVQPNPGHFALVDLENLIPAFTLVTQNIDNLHQRAGSEKIIELHGNIERNYCIKCGRFKIEIDELPPKCESCGGLVRPDVVWFGENLPEDALRIAWQKSEESTIFMVVGTSAEVYPAARLPFEASKNGAVLIVINPDETPVSVVSDYHVFEKSGIFLPLLVNALKMKLND